MAPNVHLLSFASSRIGSLSRLRSEAIALDCFSSITLLTSKDLGADYWKVCGDFVRTHPRRGFGFWTWKPYIIHRHLSTLPQGDVLLYIDAGCSLNAEGMARFRNYVARATSHPSGWFVFETGHSIGVYTKRSLLQKHLADNPADRNLPMLWAGGQFIVAQSENINLAKLWFESMNERSMIDDSPAVDEVDGFIAHRHDQSVFSILAHRHGVDHIKNETEWEPDWSTHLDYPIHARRWKHRIGWPTHWLRSPWVGRILRRI